MLTWISTKAKKDLKEILVALSISTFGDLLTALSMGYFNESLKIFPALLILIPPAIDMRGNIFSSLGSRLGTHLHTGEILPGKKNPLLRDNISSSFNLTFSMSFFLGFISWIISKRIGLEASFLELILISYLAGLFSAFIMLFLTLNVVFAGYKKGWDPDNITAPIITFAGDVFTLPLLFMSLKIITRIDFKLQFIMLMFFIFISFFSFSSIRRKNFRKIIIESTPLLIICAFLSSASGATIGSQHGELFAIPALLTILPAFLEDGGAIGGILAARFSSALFTGEIKAARKPPRKVFGLFAIVHLVALIEFFSIGVIGYAVNKFFMIPVNIFQMIAISVIAGQILIFIMDFLAYYTSIFSFKIGINPDNVTIPVLTSVADFVGSLCLVGIAYLFL
ncbi:MAG: magnesium transporter [Thermoplasmatales archaeon]|nr:magnesium transporter [Thermoplasmatales archaeon]